MCANGAFTVANKLYGITLTKLEGVPTYHPDVEVFEVKDADGSQLGIFYVDYFPRSGKSGGAWMSNYREQQGAYPSVSMQCLQLYQTGRRYSLSIDNG